MVILFYPEIRLDPVVLEEKNFFYSLLFLPILKRLLTYFIVFPLELMINYTINSRIKLVNIILLKYLFYYGDCTLLKLRSTTGN